MKLFSLVWLAAAVASAEPKHLSNLQQLTHGGQNAEAYWSPDGGRLIFQSTRPGFECDQIFIMNADGSDQKRVSTGKGRTTCGYFLGRRANASCMRPRTRSGDACPTACADRSKGWRVGRFLGLRYLSRRLTCKIEKKLTTAQGYDAEATENWKTGKIIYTSLASGDLDLWTMKPDGSDKKQITTSPGYDGGYRDVA